MQDEHVKGMVSRETGEQGTEVRVIGDERLCGHSDIEAEGAKEFRGTKQRDGRRRWAPERGVMEQAIDGRQQLFDVRRLPLSPLEFAGRDVEQEIKPKRSLRFHWG